MTGVLPGASLHPVGRSIRPFSLVFFVASWAGAPGGAFAAEGDLDPSQVEASVESAEALASPSARRPSAETVDLTTTGSSEASSPDSDRPPSDPRLVRLAITSDEPGVSLRIRDGSVYAGEFSVTTYEYDPGPRTSPTPSFSMPSGSPFSPPDSSPRLSYGVSSTSSSSLPSSSNSSETGSSRIRTVTGPAYVPNYRALCTAPCSIELFAGERVQLQVDSSRIAARGDGMRIRPSRVRIPHDALGLHVRLVDRTRQRRNAWIGFATIPVVGVALSTLARFVPETARDHDPYIRRNEPMFWAGVVLMTSPVLTFFWPVSIKHRSRITVRRAGDVGPP